MEGGKWRSKRQLAVQSTLEATRSDGRTTWLIHDLRSGEGRLVHRENGALALPKGANFRQFPPITAHHSPIIQKSLLNS
jgi:hypothetical protein